MIDNKEIEFDPPKTLNVITAHMSKHDKGINIIDDALYVAIVSELVTPTNNQEESIVGWFISGLY